ncbi:MAG: hypothetical protein WCB31_11740 [Nitrososphaeraceae archaeon]
MTDTHLIAQYNKFTIITIVDYLNHVKKRFGKFTMFVDRAIRHCSKITGNHLELK